MRMRTTGNSLVLAIALGGIAALGLAQTGQKPAFEVVSIKPTKSDNLISLSNGCRYVSNNTTLKMMVRFAYRLPNGQLLPFDRIIGGPSWTETERFDVEGKRESDAGSTMQDQFLLMVQSLLEDRFQLRIHWSTRDLLVYDLVVSNGSRLKRSDNQTQQPPPEGNRVLPCTGVPSGRLPLPQATGSRGGTLPPSPITIASDSSGVSVTSTGVPLSTLVSLLQEFVDRPIIDKTGVTALYDFKLHFSPERPGVAAPAINANAPPPTTGQAAPSTAADPSGPSIFSAIQEIGLKLEANNAPLDVLVIDSVQRPTEN